MSKLRLGPVGMALNVSADDTYLKEAAELEELGYSTIWLPGGQIDRLDRITAIIRATTSVPVASAIIPVDIYQPAAVRLLYAELQAGAPGRFIAGLGGPQQPRPLGPLNDYLDQLDHGDPPVPAGRRILGPGSTLIISQMLVLDTDAARAREAARMPLSFLSGIRGYRDNFARMGFADSDIAGLSDRLVDDLVIWGSADTVT